MKLTIVFALLACLSVGITISYADQVSQEKLEMVKKGFKELYEMTMKLHPNNDKNQLSPEEMAEQVVERLSQNDALSNEELDRLVQKLETKKHIVEQQIESGDSVVDKKQDVTVQVQE